MNDIDWENVTNLEELNATLEGREPVAVVRAQGTGSWGNKLTTAGDLADLSGIHDLYVVYNLPDRDNIGANIYACTSTRERIPKASRKTLPKETE